MKDDTMVRVTVTTWVAGDAENTHDTIYTKASSLGYGPMHDLDALREARALINTWIEAVEEAEGLGVYRS